MLVAGFGWGYLPEHMIANDLAQGKLRRLHVDGVREKNVVALLVICRRDRLLGPSARWVLSRLMEPAGQNTARNPFQEEE
jgi:DNA-binding transcriptional LysR family regulator